ncbi:hypothetical protein [Mesorhizobium sp.]|uniref:hypothetical protein n=1 Tax=Mesorhizobium sp. TaxID=1871066 RepID=UPI00257A559A
MRHAGKHCQWVRGAPVDDAVSALLLEAMAPPVIDVALAVQQEITQRVEQATALRGTQLQRARYEAELARRRYLKVDPDNRLVATRWKPTGAHGCATSTRSSASTTARTKPTARCWSQRRGASGRWPPISCYDERSGAVVASACVKRSEDLTPLLPHRGMLPNAIGPT